MTANIFSYVDTSDVARIEMLDIKKSNHKLSLVSSCGRLVGGGRCPALAVIAV